MTGRRDDGMSHEPRAMPGGCDIPSSHHPVGPTLVVGAGKSGVAAANFLAARGDRVSISDTNASPDLPYRLDDRVVRFFGNQNDALLGGVTEIVVSPGVPLTIPLLQRAAAQAIPVIGEIELAYRYLPGTVIAGTGSNG